MTIEHNTITDPDIHEPKGVAAATVDKVYVADGAASGTWKKITEDSVDATGGSIYEVLVNDGAGGVAWKAPMRMGWWDYNDLTTATTPIPLSVGGTQYELTNDGAGANTLSTYKLPEVTDVWDVATDRFDFSELALGDVVDIRFDVEYVTTTTNVAISLDIEFDVGGTPFQINIIDAIDKKAAGTYTEVHQRSFYIGSTAVRDNPIRLLATSDKTGTTVKVNGWFIEVRKRGED